MKNGLDIRLENKILILTLNRPDQLNAFTMDMIHDWAIALRRAKSDPEIGAVVLTGVGRAFCSGADLSFMDNSTQTPLGRKLDLTEHIHEVALAAQDLDKPYICALNGLAVGAGLDLTLMCDIRFASEKAKMSQGYVRVGLVPGNGGTYYLPRLVGTSKALELLWTGDWISPEEAERMGLINKVVEDEHLLDYTLEFAQRLVNGPSVAMKMIKRAVYQSQQLDLRATLDLMSSHLGIVAFTEDHQEGVRAITQKRKPEFKGR